MTPIHLRTAGLALSVTATVLATTASGLSPATADPLDRTFCSLTGLTTYAWDGGGDGSSWSDPLNWSTDLAPGPDGQDDAYVCIDGDAQVAMAPGDVARVQAIDTTIHVTLTIPDGAALLVHGTGDHASQVSGKVAVAGDLGGPGTIVDTAETDLPFYDGEVDLQDGAALVGGGVLDSWGGLHSAEGFALADGYDVIAHGSLVVGSDDGAGGIAMSPGSRIVIRPDAVATIFGDADIYPSGSGAPRPLVVNRGHIDKFRLLFGDDTGVSVISTDYRGHGTVGVGEELSPTLGHAQLVITDGSTTPVGVSADNRFGSGPCRVVADDCRFTTQRRRGARQSAVLQAPASQDTSAQVQVRPLPGLRRPGDLGHPYLVHADDLTATPSTPAIIELRFDGRLLHGRTWEDVAIFRQRAAHLPWRRIKACRADGTPRGDAAACVDRRGLAESSRQVPHSGGDAILVVRTTGTSRWVGR